MPETSTEMSPDELERHMARYDGWDPDNAQHWHEIVGYARDKCPVAHSDAYGGFWVVSSNDVVRQVLANPQIFSSRDGTQIPVEDRIRKPPQDMDPPLQSDFRRLLNRFFSLRGLERHRAMFHDIAHAQVEAVVAKGDGRFEVVADYARPITTEVLCRVLFDLDDQGRYQELSATTAHMGIGSAESNAQTFARLQELVADLIDGLSERERKDDVLDAVLYGQVEGRLLTRTEKVGTMLMLLLGGLKTTVSAIANIVNQMTIRPGLEAELREPSWDRRYLDELLRYESPIKMVGRRVLQDTMLGGQEIRAGEMVAALIGSANRDPAVFDDADAICPDRANNPHVTFGLGVHRCIGSNLARVEIVSAIDALLARTEHLRRADEEPLVRATSQVELVWDAVPVAFDLRA